MKRDTLTSNGIMKSTAKGFTVKVNRKLICVTSGFTISLTRANEYNTGNVIA